MCTTTSTQTLTPPTLAALKEEANDKIRRVQQISKRQGNQTCADCPARRPLWVSFLLNSNNNGEKEMAVLCCSQCIQHHNDELGNERCKIKYSRMVHEWSMEDIATLENTGNRMVNKLYEANLTMKDFDKDLVMCTADKEWKRRAKFIRNKYKKCKYQQKRSEDKQRASSSSMDTSESSTSSSHDEEEDLMRTPRPIRNGKSFPKDHNRSERKMRSSTTTMREPIKRQRSRSEERSSTRTNDSMAVLTGGSRPAPVVRSKSESPRSRFIRQEQQQRRETSRRLERSTRQERSTRLERSGRLERSTRLERSKEPSSRQGRSTRQERSTRGERKETSTRQERSSKNNKEASKRGPRSSLRLLHRCRSRSEPKLSNNKKEAKSSRELGRHRSRSESRIRCKATKAMKKQVSARIEADKYREGFKRLSPLNVSITPASERESTVKLTGVRNQKEEWQLSMKVPENGARQKSSASQRFKGKEVVY